MGAWVTTIGSPSKWSSWVIFLPPLVISVAGLGLALALYLELRDGVVAFVPRQARHAAAMVALKRNVSSGSNTFLIMQYGAMAVFALIICVLAATLVRWEAGVTVAIGVLASALDGWVSMRASTLAYFRCSVAAVIYEQNCRSTAGRRGRGRGSRSRSRVYPEEDCTESMGDEQEDAEEGRGPEQSSDSDNEGEQAGDEDEDDEVDLGLNVVMDWIPADADLTDAQRERVRRTKQQMRGCISHIALLGSACTGLTTQCISLFSITLLLLLFNLPLLGEPLLPDLSLVAAMTGFGLGASIVSAITRVGGGIYVRACELSHADPYISRTDGRNAVSVADLIGKNVGTVAGTAADLLSSFSGAVITTLVIGYRVTEEPSGIVLPLWAGMAGTVSSACGLLFLLMGVRNERVLDHGDMHIVATALVYLLQLALLACITLILGTEWRFFACLSIGVITGVLLSLWFAYFSSEYHSPFKTVVGAVNYGSRILLLEGLSNGMKATVGPAVLSAAAIIATRYIGGSIYGITLGTLGALSTVSMHITLDLLSPIASNARAFMGICRFSAVSQELVASVCRSSRRGALAGRGFVAAAATLSAISLLFTYITKADLDAIELSRNDRLIAGTLLGACVPYLFAALPLSSIARVGAAGTSEVMRQLADPAIFQHLTQPDYARCIKLLQALSLYSMVVPALIPFASPFVVGIGLGPNMLVGFLVGMISSGYLLGTMLSLSGGSWEVGEEHREKAVEATSREPTLPDQTHLSGITILPSLTGGKHVGADGDGDRDEEKGEREEKDAEEVIGSERVLSGVTLLTEVQGAKNNLSVGSLSFDASSISSCSEDGMESDDDTAASVLAWYGNGTRERVRAQHSRQRAESTSSTSTTTACGHRHPHPHTHRRKLRHIGDPFKDVTGSSLNILFKSACYVSVVFAPIISTGNSLYWWISLCLILVIALLLVAWKSVEPRALSSIYSPPPLPWHLQQSDM